MGVTGKKFEIRSRATAAKVLREYCKEKGLAKQLALRTYALTSSKKIDAELNAGHEDELSGMISDWVKDHSVSAPLYSEIVAEARAIATWLNTL